MAHQIDFSNGRANMAYVGDTPWHGLGQALTPNSPIETWKREAGMAWEIQDAPVKFDVDGSSQIYTGSRVLYRSDTKEQLSIVSDNYKVVQPGEVLDFFRDLVAQQGMVLNTAGVLFGGRRFWALADTGRAADVLGNDRIKGMLLLTTSCDGSMATNAMFTSVRVVCNNTLTFAMNDSGATRARITHSSKFDPAFLKDQLGLLDSAWEKFKEQITDMSKAKLSDNDADKFLRKLIEKPNLDAEKQPYTVQRDINAIMGRYRDGMGTNKTEGTLWGLVNSVTEFVDHEDRARIKDHALWGSWFGKGANMKNKAFEQALALV